jgi:hypothetical protein
MSLKGRFRMLGIDHQHGREREKQSLEQIRALVEASGEVRFHSQDRGELYAWVNRTLRQQDYGRLKRGGKGFFLEIAW